MTNRTWGPRANYRTPAMAPRNSYQDKGTYQDEWGVRDTSSSFSARRPLEIPGWANVRHNCRALVAWQRKEGKVRLTNDVDRVYWIVGKIGKGLTGPFPASISWVPGYPESGKLIKLPQKGCGSAAAGSDLLFCYFYLIIYDKSEKEIYHNVG